MPIILFGGINSEATADWPRYWYRLTVMTIIVWTGIIITGEGYLTQYWYLLWLMWLLMAKLCGENDGIITANDIIEVTRRKLLVAIRYSCGEEPSVWMAIGVTDWLLDPLTFSVPYLLTSRPMICW